MTAPPDRTYRLANRLGAALLRARRVETRWTGLQHLPTTGPVLLAANHVAYPDFIFIEQAARERGRMVRFMCRNQAWQVPLVNRALDAMGHIAVDRAGPAGAYLRARSLVRNGEAVGVFPEAGISRSFTVRALMRGAAALGRETGVPVVPVAIWGTQRLWPVGQSRPDLTPGRPIDLAFGEPRFVPAGADLTRWTIGLGTQLTEMLEQLQSLPRHQPRPGERAAWHPAHLGGRALDRAAAAELEDVPSSAVPPQWGPPVGVRAGAASMDPGPH